MVSENNFSNRNHEKQPYLAFSRIIEGCDNQLSRPSLGFLVKNVGGLAEADIIENVRQLIISTLILCSS